MVHKHDTRNPCALRKSEISANFLTHKTKAIEKSDNWARHCRSLFSTSYLLQSAWTRKMLWAGTDRCTDRCGLWAVGTLPASHWPSYVQTASLSLTRHQPSLLCLCWNSRKTQQAESLPVYYWLCHGWSFRNKYKREISGPQVQAIS